MPDITRYTAEERRRLREQALRNSKQNKTTGRKTTPAPVVTSPVVANKKIYTSPVKQSAPGMPPAVRSTPDIYRREIDKKFVTDMMNGSIARMTKYAKNAPTNSGEVTAARNQVAANLSTITRLQSQYAETDDQEMKDLLANAYGAQMDFNAELDSLSEYIRQFDTPQQQKAYEFEDSLDEQFGGMDYAGIEEQIAAYEADLRAEKDPANRSLIQTQIDLLKDYARSNPSTRTPALRDALADREQDLIDSAAAYGAYNEAARNTTYDAVMADNYLYGDRPSDDAIIARIDYAWRQRETELRSQGVDEATIAEYHAAYESAKDDPALWWANQQTAQQDLTTPEEMAAARQGIEGVESPWHIEQNIDRLNLDISESESADRWREYEQEAANSPKWDRYFANAAASVYAPGNDEVLGNKKRKLMGLVPTKYDNMYITPEYEAYYQYIKDTYGADMASDYAEYAESAVVDPALVTKAERFAEDINDSNAVDRTMASAASRLINSVSGLPGAADAIGTTLASWISGQSVAPGAAPFMPYVDAANAFSETIDAGISEDLNSLGTVNDVVRTITGKDINIPAIGSMGWGDAYQSVASRADSILSTMVGGKFGFAAGVASDAYHDAFEKGYSDGQSIITGLASVLTEALPEYLSIDFSRTGRAEILKYLKSKGGFTLAVLGQALGKVGLSAGLEGGQEGATTFMNQGLDRAVGGQNSDYWNRVKELSQNGLYMTEEEAAQQANREQWENVGRDAAAGFVGALLTGAGDAGVNVANEINTYKKVQKNLQSIREAPAPTSRAGAVRPPEGTVEATKAKADERIAGMKTAEGDASMVGDKPVKVHAITKTGDDVTVRVTDESGAESEVKLSDVAMGKDARSEVYAYAADMATPELANTFRGIYKPGQNIESVAHATSFVYEMAEGGMSEASLRKSSVTTVLDDEQFQTVYKLAKDTRVANIARADEKATERLKSLLGNSWRGGTLKMGEVVEAALSGKQREDVELVRVMAGISGINVELFQSTANEAGRFTRENGYYNRATNTIYLDVNAGRNYAGDSMAKTALLRTMSHEMTHAIQANSPAIYGKLQEAVLETLSSQGIDIEDRIAHVMTRDSSVKTRAAALDEIVADACETMLRDSEAAQRFKEAHPEEARTLGQRILKFIKNITDAIKRAFSGEAGAKSAEAKALLKDMDALKKIADIWTEGAMQVSEISGRDNGEAVQSETQDEVVDASETVGQFDEPARPEAAHIDQRDWDNVADDDVHAFQNDYKFARNWMGLAARVLTYDVDATLPGKRFMNEDGEWQGQKRQTTDLLAYLKDEGKWTWDQIGAALDKIASFYENGDLETDMPNSRRIKRIELVLDDMLSNGYTTMDGIEIAPDRGWLEYKKELPGAEVQAIPENAVYGAIEEYAGNTQFSMRSDVEKVKGLVAVHNLNAERLRLAVELGGFPPSIAIVKAKQGHSKFGSVSVVFRSVTIDPSVPENRVYGADAWTATFPDVKFEVDEKKYDSLYSDLYTLLRGLPDFITSSRLSLLNKMDNGVSKDSFETIFDAAKNNLAMKAAYVAEQKGDIEVHRKQVAEDLGFNEEYKERYDRFINGYDGDISEITHRSLENIAEANGTLLESLLPLKVMPEHRKRMRIAKFISEVNAYLNNTEVTYKTVVDQKATVNGIETQIDDKGFEHWLHKKLDGILKGRGIRNQKDMFTPSGNRRSFKQLYSPFTLEGIVSAMRAKSGRNAATGHVNMIAAASREYGSIDEIKADSERLSRTDQAEHDAHVKELNERMDAAIDEIVGKRTNGLGRYSSIEQAQWIIAENAPKKAAKTSMKRAFVREGYTVNDVDVNRIMAILTEMRDMPTVYFEAKPERAVGIDEVAAVIVPDDLDERTRKAIAGMNVIEYEAGNDASRLDALNSLENVQFSRRSIDRESEARYNKTGWTTENGVLSHNELHRFESMLSTQLHGGKMDRHKTKDGLWAIAAYDDNDVQNIVVVTDGKPLGQNIHRVYRIYSEYDTYAEEVRDAIYAAESTYGKNAPRNAQKYFETGNIGFFEREDFDYYGSDGRHLGGERGRGGTLGGTSERLSERSGREEASGQDGSVKRSSRDPYEVSDREILANAFEDVAKTADEKAWLAAYKKDLAELNSTQAVLDENRAVVRELLFKAGRTTEENERLKKATVRVKTLSERLAKRDAALLKVEAAAPLRAIVAREGKKVREKMRQKEREDIAKIRQTQENAAYRQRIVRKVKRLDELLRNPTDQKHVPDNLKAATLDMLSVFTQDTSVFDKEKLERVRREYAELTNRDADTSAAGLYDEDTAERIALLADTIGEKRLSQLTRAELDEVTKVIDHFAHLIKDANTLFVNGRRENLETLAMQAIEEAESMKRHASSKANMSALWKLLKEGMITPAYFFRRIGGTMGRLGEAILEGETRYGVELNKANERITPIQEKYHYSVWAHAKNDNLTFTTEEGESLTLNRGQALSIYATDKRERNEKIKNPYHLSRGGIVLARDDLKLLKRTDDEHNGITLSESDIKTVNAWLTEEQKAYADAMVGYMSRNLAEMGNEVSINLHGYSKFGEGFYFPYKTYADMRPTKLGETEVALIKNMSHSKATQRGATATIVIDDFTNTVKEHISNMLTYASLAVSQDNFMRVFDYKIGANKKVATVLANAWGKSATSYVVQFMNDIYGGVVQDKTDKLADAFVSRMKKIAVMGNASVVIQQYWSLTRSMAYIDPKYFVGKPHRNSFNEAMKYAGTAVIKDIGRFDTSTGKTVVEWMGVKEPRKVKEKVDDFFGYFPEKADKLAWGTMWNAVKREQAAKTGLDINSEQLKEIAGRRFDKIMRLTQVYDSVMAKSEIMRSKSAYAKMLTSFMAEGTVSYNMTIDALFDKQTSGKAKVKRTSRILSAVMASMVLLNLAKSLVYAARDDDDEEATYGERYVTSVAEGLTTDLLFYNNIPFVKDIVSVFQGYDVQRTDTAIFSDAKAAWDTMQNDEKSMLERARSLAVILSLISGVPFNNVWRDIESAHNMGITIVAEVKGEREPREGWFGHAVKYGIGSIFGMQDTKSHSTEKLLDAVLAEDASEVAMWREHMSAYNGMDEKQINSALANAIHEALEGEEIDSAQAQALLMKYAGHDEDEAETKLNKWLYEMDTGNNYSDMKEQFLAGEITEEDAVQARMEYGGVSEEKARKTVSEWQFEKDYDFAYSDMEEAFKDGDITKQQAIEARLDSGAAEDDAYWDVTGWEYEKQTGNEWKGRATKLNAAMASGNLTTIEEAITELYDHNTWKNPSSELTGDITAYWKPLYVAATEAERKAMLPLIYDCYELAYTLNGEVYYGDDNVWKKRIKRWESD